MIGNSKLHDPVKQQNGSMFAAEAQKQKNENAYSFNNGSATEQVEGGQSMVPPPLNIQASEYQTAKAGLLAELEGPNWGEYGQASGSAHAMSTFDLPASYASQPAQSNETSGTPYYGLSPQGLPLLNKLYDEVTGDASAAMDVINNPAQSILGEQDFTYGGTEWELGPLSFKTPSLAIQSGDFDKDGNPVSGLNLGVNLGSASYDNGAPGFVNSGKIEGPAMEYKNYQDEDGNTAYWKNASLGGISGKMGTSDPDSDDDGYIEVGTGFGGGVGLDTFPTDQDKDANKEYGPKVNTPGPSVDVKSEDPLKTLVLGLGGSKAVDSDSNWTQKALGWLPF